MDANIQTNEVILATQGNYGHHCKAHKPHLEFQEQREYEKNYAGVFVYGEMNVQQSQYNIAYYPGRWPKR